jgi:hypothetical protein
MSANYPNRADWLAIRKKIKPQDVAKCLHVSAKLGNRYNPVTKAIQTVVVETSTYNVGRNAAKRASKAVAA